MYKHERGICQKCMYQLPKSGFTNMAENPITEIFAGRVSLHSATSFLLFRRGNSVQHIMHALKYRGDKEIGYIVGKLFGAELKKSPLFNTANYVIPVPLHAKKLKKRGYNQAEVLAVGIAEGMGISVDVNSLVREVYADSQTRKARFKRWENVENAFVVKTGDFLEGKHVIVTDDVVTTGATLEAGLQALLSVPNIKLSVATLAFAWNI